MEIQKKVYNKIVKIVHKVSRGYPIAVNPAVLHHVRCIINSGQQSPEPVKWTWSIRFLPARPQTHFHLFQFSSFHKTLICRESFTTPCKTGEKQALRGKTCFCCFKPISFLQVPAWMYGNHYGGGVGLIREAGLWWGNRAQGLMKRVTSAPLTESPPMGPPFRSDMPRRLSPQTLQTQTAGVCIGV